MTKEELVGRKFTNSLDQKCQFTHFQSGKIYASNRGSSPFEVGDEGYCNAKIKEGTWKLLPEEQMTYTTPKGIKYGVGTKFTHPDSGNTEYTISYVGADGVGYDGANEPTSGLCSFNQYLDDGVWAIIQDYQSVDPSTIKFDFTNTKIRVNSPEESEWIQKAAFNNGVEWYTGSYIQCTTAELLILKDYIGRVSLDGFANSRTREITIQDILNNMKEVIEVGDVVEYKDSNMFGVHKYEVTRITDSYFTFKEGGTGTKENYKLHRKANKQEIIGYELLKDLPGIPAGTKSTPFMGKGRGGVVFVGTTSFDASDELLQDTTWFKPIYKTKEVIVSISGGREVKITTDTTTIRVNGIKNNIFNKDIMKLHTMLNLKSVLETTSDNKWPIVITAFKIGCQEFTKEDIELVYQEITKLK